MTDSDNQGYRYSVEAIYETKLNADAAMDAYLETHHSLENLREEAAQRERDAARRELHVALTKWYNRLRPWLQDQRDLYEKRTLYDDGENQLTGLQVLDDWRTASVQSTETVSRVGKTDQTVNKEMPATLPEQALVNAYDALNDAMVELDFAVQSSEADPETDLSDVASSTR